MAVGSIKSGLLPMTQTSMRFVDHIGYHDYEGPAVDLAERALALRPGDAQAQEIRRQARAGEKQAFESIKIE